MNKTREFHQRAAAAYRRVGNEQQAQQADTRAAMRTFRGSTIDTSIGTMFWCQGAEMYVSIPGSDEETS